MPTHADPLASEDIYVIDGDTIAVHGQRIRLVGFDAPELGGHAHCGIERMLAARATSRLRQIIRTGDDIDLQLVDCSCWPGTEGTRWCDYGRACGYLTVDGPFEPVQQGVQCQTESHGAACVDTRSRAARVPIDR